MTDYTVTQTHARQASAFPFSPNKLFRNWRARRQIRKLQDHDDRVLDDIGVTRDEVAWASYLPLAANAARELEQASYRRRKEEQLKWL